MPKVLTTQQQSDASKGREPATRPETLKEKLAHFWDYHKWMIFFGVLIFVFGIYMLSYEDEKYDYHIAVYCSPGSAEEVDALYQLPCMIAKNYGNDLNGDGKTNAETMVADLTNENIGRDNYNAVIAHMQLNIEGMTPFMAFITDRVNYDFFISGGDDLFTSFEGASKWVPLNHPELTAKMAEMGITAELGMVIIEKTDKIDSKKSRAEDYSSALDFMASLKTAFPEMFGYEEIIMQNAE